MSTYSTILSLVVIASLIVIVFHIISTLVYRDHSRHIRDNSLSHAPLLQIGQEWEEVYEPGDTTPFDQTSDYNPSQPE